MLTKNRDFACFKDQGARPYQEDEQGFSYLKLSEETLCLLSIVSDGMGGENAGDVASALVIKEFVYACHEQPYDSISKLLESAAIAANATIAKSIKDDSSLEGMGATLLSALILDGLLYWVSIGDSPLYLYRAGEVIRLNEDHSMMPVLVQKMKNGALSESELATHPDRNVLRSAIVGDEIDLIDVSQEGLTLEENDIIICASDGLDTLPVKEIAEKIEQYEELNAQELSKKLVQAVKNKSKPRQDNIAVNIIKFSMTPVSKEFKGDTNTRLISR